MPLTIDKFLKKANSEIYFLGITLQSLTHKIDSMRIALEKIRILICDPESDYMNEIEKVVDSQKRVIVSSVA